MKLRSIIAASVMAGASWSAAAIDLVVPVATSAIAHFNGIDALFDGGSDDISFTGLAPGLYSVTVTISGQNVNFDAVTSNLNGTTGASPLNGVIAFFNVNHTGVEPFALHLFGTDLAGASGYSGDVSITAVPEPETYALLLAGLTAMTFVARRRRPT